MKKYTIVELEHGELIKKDLDLFNSFEEAYSQAREDADAEFDALNIYSQIDDDYINYYHNIIFDTNKIIIFQNDQSLHERHIYAVETGRK